MMHWTDWLIAYVFGWLVVGSALVESPDRRDIAASFIAALAWPVMVPARLLRRLIRAK